TAQEFLGTPTTPRLLNVLQVVFELWWLIRGENRRLRRDLTIGVLDRVTFVNDQEGLVGPSGVGAIEFAFKDFLRSRLHSRVVAGRYTAKVQFDDLYHGVSSLKRNAKVMPHLRPREFCDPFGPQARESRA